MLSARSLFQEMYDDREAFRLMCSLAAAGEAQGGWENARISALVGDPDLGPKIARHGADEDRHGRIFTALLTRRDLTPIPVPQELDYVGLLEKAGIGVAHAKLRAGRPLDRHDIIAYLAHGRVTEQRGAEQMRTMVQAYAGQSDMHRALKVICRDEERHLAYCHEELLRLADAGHQQEIRGALRRAALTEIRIYRDVSADVLKRMAQLLGWPRAKTRLLLCGVHAVHLIERLGRWRRLVTLRMPELRNALGGPAPATTIPDLVTERG